MPQRYFLVAVCLAAGVLGCASADDPSDGDEWGPMVVYDLPRALGGDAGIGDGVLRFDDDCVVLDRGEFGFVLLLFEESTVRWDGEAIHFQGDREGVFDLVFYDGDEVGAGGGSPIGEDGEWMVELDYLRPPPEGCVGDPRFASSLELIRRP